MTDSRSWIQENWYQLGSFFIQCGFLFIAIWFARKVLRTLRSSQEQVGALLKIAVAGIAPDRHSESVDRSASEYRAPVSLLGGKGQWASRLAQRPFIACFGGCSRPLILSSLAAGGQSLRF